MHSSTSTTKKSTTMSTTTPACDEPLPRSPANRDIIHRAGPGHPSGTGSSWVVPGDDQGPFGRWLIVGHPHTWAPPPCLCQQFTPRSPSVGYAMAVASRAVDTAHLRAGTRTTHRLQEDWVPAGQCMRAGNLRSPAATLQVPRGLMQSQVVLRVLTCTTK